MAERSDDKIGCWEFFKIFCCPPCPRRITEKIAFRPPKPPSYELVDMEHHGVQYTIHLSPNVDSSGLSKVISQDTRFVRTAFGNNIAVLHLKTNPKSNYTIIFSHGNAIDLGGVHRWLTDLSTLTGCDVVSYDYSGYGQSEGRPSEKNMYADIWSVWKYTLTFHEPDSKKIILYGRSLGCVPSVHLASKVKFAGVILQSAFTSSYRFIYPNNKDPISFLDTMKCIDMVSKVDTPILVIHGTEDDVIDISHGVEIYGQCARPVEPLWVEGARHNNLEGRRQYAERLLKFINEELDT